MRRSLPVVLPSGLRLCEILTTLTGRAWPVHLKIEKNMFAVIKTGGKQYKVAKGDVLIIEKLDSTEGEPVIFDQVLMLGDGDKVTIGEPLVAGAQVRAELLETRKGAKIIVFKKKRRKGYRRTKGHRQFETVVRVSEILPKGAKPATKPAAKPAAVKKPAAKPAAKKAPAKPAAAKKPAVKKAASAKKD